MGKKVCEDWASILLNSKTHIKISDEQTNLFVQGRRETEGILGANSFWTKGNRLVEIDDDGTEIAPDDVHQQLFTFIKFPEENQSDGKKFIQEFNPALRVDDNTKGVQSALDYLSFKCGLGNKHYQFNGSTVVTATQYTGDKQDLIQNADKHYAEVERFLLSLVRSIIHIGKNLMGANVADNAEIEIDFDRSVIIDDTAERLQDLQEVRDGVKAPWEYRMKYYGETEEDAKKIFDEIKGMENVDLGFEDGDA